MMKETVQAADCETHCQCCGRKNRKLYLIQGGWVGVDCRDDVNAYRETASWGGNPANEARFYNQPQRLKRVADFCERTA